MTTHLSWHECKALQKRLGHKLSVSISVDGSGNKYGNKKTVVGGIKFHSRKEAEYYKTLLLLKEAGEVAEIELQPRFLLQEGFTKNGEYIRPIYYKADFKVTYADGHTEIVDVKGYQTNVFKLKRKLFEYRYPNLRLKIVK